MLNIVDCFLPFFLPKISPNPWVPAGHFSELRKIRTIWSRQKSIMKDAMRLKADHEKLAIFPHIFFFAIIWSFGAVVDGASRSKFDSLIRKEMERLQIKFPKEGTVFDYFFDFKAMMWSPWLDEEYIKEFTEPSKIFSLGMVPTKDNTSRMYLMDMLIEGTKPVLVYGDMAGIGKTFEASNVRIGCLFSRMISFCSTA